MTTKAILLAQAILALHVAASEQTDTKEVIVIGSAYEPKPHHLISITCVDMPAIEYIAPEKATPQPTEDLVSPLTKPYTAYRIKLDFR
jgi:hypothetical protein